MSALPLPDMPAINPPRALRRLRGWLLWRFEMKPGDKKPRKVPYYANGRIRQGTQGSEADRARMVDFDTAMQALARRYKGPNFDPDTLNAPGFNGIGLAMYTDWSLVALDFDGCVDGGVVRPQVLDLVQGTYAEISPSGTGVRAFMAGEMADRKAHGIGLQFGIETFHAKGFVTFTGNLLEGWDLFGFDQEIVPLTDEMVAYCGERFGADSLKPEPYQRDADTPAPQGLDDAQLREILSHIDPNADKYETWLRTGQELHHETEGEERGLDLWDDWSRGEDGVNYPGRDVLAAKWAGFGRGSGRQATIGSTMQRAREAGWQPPIVDDFEALPALVDGVGEAVQELPNFRRDKHGQIEAVIENVAAAVRRADLIGVRVAYDAFRDDIVVAPDGTDDWQPLRDADYTRYRIRLAEQLGFKPVGYEMIRDAVVLVAEECIIDSAQWWLSRQVWDGVPRVERFLTGYFGTEDTPYARAVSRYLWSALAGRVLAPGCQVDMVPILEGEQGLRKTSAVAAIAPGYSHFIEIGFDEKETDLARKMRGALVAELGELHGLHAKAIEGVKKFITRRYENWTPKYKEFNTTFPRRLVFIGTTNQTELLADETGNRRWLPIHVTWADVEGIARDRGQLWAEGAAMFREGGVQFREAEKLAGPMHELYLSADAWEEPIKAWLETDMDFAEEGKPAVKWAVSPFSSMDVAIGALRITAGQVHAGVTRRIGAILRKLGYKQKTTRIEGVEKPVLRWRAENC